MGLISKICDIIFHCSRGLEIVAIVHPTPRLQFCVGRVLGILKISAEFIFATTGVNR